MDLIKATLSSPNFSFSSTNVFSPSSLLMSDRQTYCDDDDGDENDDADNDAAYDTRANADNDDDHGDDDDDDADDDDDDDDDDGGDHLSTSGQEPDCKSFAESLSRARDDCQLALDEIDHHDFYDDYQCQAEPMITTTYPVLKTPYLILVLQV